jgi:hypothetical protein
MVSVLEEVVVVLLTGEIRRFVTSWLGVSIVDLALAVV